jgi:hypothetical protein
MNGGDTQLDLSPTVDVPHVGAHGSESAGDLALEYLAATRRSSGRWRGAAVCQSGAVPVSAKAMPKLAGPY